MSIIARLGAVLGLDTKEFVKGVDIAQQKSKEFKKSLKETQQTVDGLKNAFFAAQVAFTAFAAAAMNTADEIADLADANDTTIGKVLELKHALVMSGGDAAKIGQFYSSFTNAIDGAAQGNDKLRDSFAEIGISIRDIAILSQQELQGKALVGLSKIDDQVRRNALAFDLFGKAAKGVNFQAMAENAEHSAGAYEKQAAAIKSAADAAQKIELLFGDMKIAALAAIKPVSDLINKIPAEHRIEAMTKAFQALGVAIGVAFGVTAVKGVVQFGKALRMIAVTNPWLLALTAAGGAAAYFGLDKLLGGQSEESNTEEPFGGDANRTIAQSQKDKIKAKYDADLELMQRNFEIRQKNALDDFKNQKIGLDLENQKALLSTNEYNRRLIYLDLAKEETKALQTYENELEAARKELLLASADEHDLAERNYNEKKKLLDKAYDDELELRNKTEELRIRNFDNEIARQQSWQAGWDEAFKKYTEASEKASERGAAAFEAVMSNMETALKNFVETGKLNFADFIGNIVKQILYAEAKAKATALFKTMFSIFGFGGNAPGTAPIEERSVLPTLATGGLIDRPSIVGENGAELFIPRTPGTIIPNGSWQQMMSGNSGGLTVNGNYIANMSAIDTQSGMQFLAANKNAVWAAYQSANRSIPISR